MEIDVLAAISTVGFPIVAFLLMFWQNTKVIKGNTTVLRELVEELRRRR